MEIFIYIGSFCNEPCDKTEVCLPCCFMCEGDSCWPAVNGGEMLSLVPSLWTARSCNNSSCSWRCCCCCCCATSICCSFCSICITTNSNSQYCISSVIPATASIKLNRCDIDLLSRFMWKTGYEGAATDIPRHTTYSKLSTNLSTVNFTSAHWFYIRLVGWCLTALTRK